MKSTRQIYSLSRSARSYIFGSQHLAPLLCRSYAAAAPATTPKKKSVDKKPAESDSFAFNLFRGKVALSQVLPYPVKLEGEMQEHVQMIVQPAEKFFSEINDAMANDANEAVSPESIEHLKNLGAFGMLVPEEYEGAGLGNLGYARMSQIIGENDLGLGIFVGAHQSIGYKGILLYGTKEQKEKYLPDVATGRKYAAFCLTEPSSGSDASSIRCRAVPAADGTHWVLNGSKIWISNGGIAEVMTVFAQTPVKDPATGQTKDKITAFVVERGFGGVRNGPPEKKMGIKASNTAEVFFEDCKIPNENVLGEVGQGFKVAMNILNNGRFGMATTLAGTMKHCIGKAVDHATNRTQFGSKIHTYGAIQEKLARMCMLQYVTETMGYLLAANMDRGVLDYQVEAAISKIFASEAAWNVTDDAIQILGGMGYMKECGLERVMRDLRIFRIFEGTNDILRLFVALTGMQFAGGHLRELQKALQNPASNFGLLLGETAKRAGKYVGLASVDGTLSANVHPNLAKPAQLASMSIQAFGYSVEEMLVRHGKNIVDQQFLLWRVADAAIDIYGMVATIARASRSLDANSSSAVMEENIVKLWCNIASERVQRNLNVLKSAKDAENFSIMSQISQEVCELKGIPASRNPLGF
ncbi:unnamed protein product [Notodromas monacha]|uniref:Very long-chain specific acyl-CoA dehydrogenase, mitochondrial n=1 Tax=Notodromas monacha TaxID=399045 RepID=A0A7R9GAE1_9CRUS|nr:unnamed protein product [Notodromas monacha]CAG0913999.1 unnamed protein product [Notodromas monacha]